MSEHTPGPWKAQEDLDILAFNPDGTVRSVVATAWGRTAEEAGANARLIAASIDLLAACQAFLAAWRDFADDSTNDLMDALEFTVLPKVREAVNKATGETP